MGPRTTFHICRKKVRILVLKYILINGVGRWYQEDFETNKNDEFGRSGPLH